MIVHCSSYIHTFHTIESWCYHLLTWNLIYFLVSDMVIGGSPWACMCHNLIRKCMHKIINLSLSPSFNDSDCETRCIRRMFLSWWKLIYRTSESTSLSSLIHKKLTLIFKVILLKGVTPHLWIRASLSIVTPEVLLYYLWFLRWWFQFWRSYHWKGGGKPCPWFHHQEPGFLLYSFLIARLVWIF